MNQTYKSIWSDKTKTFVAVAENTASKGKASSSQVAATGGMGKAFNGILMAFGLSAMALGVQAATVIGSGAGITETSTDAINGSQSHATHQVIEENKTHYYSVSDGGTAKGNYNNDGASGIYSIAAGVGAEADGSNSVAMGTRAKATRGDTTAIGTSANATLFGATALGHGATANHMNSVALGAGSETAAAVGTSSIKLLGKDYNFAGATPTSTVSVGSVGNERTITNVAAGRITETSTDAINGSQLHATHQAIGDVTAAAALGLDFAGNDGDVVNRVHGQTLGIKGGITDAATETSGENVITRTDTDGNINIELAKNANFESITTGETVMNNAGITVGENVSMTNQGFFIKGGPSITGTGINAGGFKITDVLAGENDTDAVNFSQLKDVKQDVADLGGQAVKYDGNTGDPKDTITLEGDKGTTIANLADGTIGEDSKNAVNGGQIHEMGGSIAAGMGGGSKFEDGKLITELNVDGKKYGNVNDALGGVHGDLSTKIENVENAANAGWNVTDAKGNTSKIGPNGSVEFTGDKNISVAQTGSDNKGQVEVTLNQDLNVNSISAIDVNATNVKTDTITINNGGPVINSDGIDMNDKKITNVAAGEAPTDAVNVSQLEGVQNNLSNEIGSVRRDLHKVDRKLRAGVAAAMATAGLPQAYLPGKSMVAVGGGTWKGESGVALGVSKITDNGKWVMKVSGNASTRGDYGGTVGGGYQW